MSKIGDDHKTGQCLGSGIFRCMTCSEIRKIKNDETLPICKKTNEPTQWRRQSEAKTAWQ